MRRDDIITLAGKYTCDFVNNCVIEDNAIIPIPIKNLYFISTTQLGNTGSYYTYYI